MRVYLASSYSHKEEISRLAREVFSPIDGVEVVSTWHEQLIDEIDFYDRTAKVYADKDLHEIDSCDVFVLFAESAGASVSSGRHVEYGYALAMRKRIVIVGGFENVFQSLANFSSYSLDSVLIALEIYADVFIWPGERPGGRSGRL